MLTDELRAKGIVAEDPRSLDIFEIAHNIASFNVPVLILGESGTGKDVLARFIHDSSRQHQNTYQHMNCCAIPDSLFETEFYGYTGSSFTGASSHGKSGLLDTSKNGTIFLDEIGDLSISNQAKLLKLTATDQLLAQNTRLICATNKNLQDAVAAGTFRKDLFYRIQGATLELLPLRKRPLDVIALAKHYASCFTEETGISKHFTDDALEVISLEPWAGNIRELKNFIEKIWILEREEVLTKAILKEQYLASQSEPIIRTTEGNTSAPSSLKAAMDSYERSYIETAIRESKTYEDAAKRLGIDLSTLKRKRQKYGL